MNSNEILNYRYFYDNEDFVNWQIKNPKAMITQVIPVLGNVKIFVSYYTLSAKANSFPFVGDVVRTGENFE